MKDSLKIAIAGATGYTGLELVKILLRHPKVIISYLCAQKSIGKSITFFDRTIKTIIYGIQDTIVVNESSYYSGLMMPFGHLSDDDISAISTYILNSWGNNGGNVTSEMVNSNR